MTTNIQRYLHSIISTLLALAASLAVASCGGGGGAGVPAEPDAPEDIMVNLTFDVTVPDGGGGASSSRSRAGEVVTTPDGDNYFEPGIEPYEQIHTLRVIILRPQKVKADDGTLTETGSQVVEVNRYFTFNNVGVVFYDNLQFEVVGGEKKSIYLLANEARVAASQPEGFTLESLTPGTLYTPGTLEDLTISADPATNILIDNTPSSTAKAYLPMSEAYHDIDIKMPATTDLRTQNIGTLFITRTPVKFTFNVTSNVDDSYFVSDVTFNSLTNKEYYLPRNTVYAPGVNGSDTPYPSLAGQFIKSYEIPSGTENFSYNFDCGQSLPLTATSHSYAPQIYFCESHSENAYTVNVTLSKFDSAGNKTVVRTFENLTLPNLPILPRNTHVKVTMNYNNSLPTCVVEVVPYTGVNLNPGFGVVDRQ